MQKLKRIAAMLLMIVVLSIAATATAFAETVPDLNRIGSITVTQQVDGETVLGGSYTLYRVGDIKETDGSCSFALTKNFAGSRLLLKDLDSPELAEDLASYAERNDVEGLTCRVGKGGVVYFEELKPGLYLLVQETAAAGYNKADPFLVTVPLENNGEYLYDVDSSPKMELEKKPTTPDRPSPDGDDRLPQTGQLNWPIPVLAIGGLVIFAAGWVLVLCRKRGGHES